MLTYTSIQKLHELFIQQKQLITTDTRKVIEGSLFFALKGDNFNANDFATEAIEKGCAYAIADDEKLAGKPQVLLVPDVLDALQQMAKYHRSQLTCKIIGITGSNGKTTNKELIHAVLSKKYNTYATKGNLNNHIGVPLTLLAINKQHQMAIVEMGANHQGEIALLSSLCDPDYGLITNIGKAHLEGFGGVEGIKKGKGELYHHLKQKNAGIFINAEDEVLLEMSGDLKKITYGENNTCDVYGELHKNSEFVEFRWNTRGLSTEHRPLVKTNMFGHYNFINVLCAVCIGNYFEVAEHEINEAISHYVPEMNRSQVKKTNNNTLILDAYNANPSSMGIAITNFANQELGNKLVVLGDMLELGDFSDAEHALVLQQLQQYNIANAMLVGPLFLKHKGKYTKYNFFETTDELVEYLKNNKQTGKIILIKGSRGIKLEKITDVL